MTMFYDYENVLGLFKGAKKARNVRVQKKYRTL